jgi:hypothetical protein
MGKASSVAAAACAATLLATQGQLAMAGATSVTGNDILNFALQLDCLEGEFYSYAAFGKGLSDEQRGGGPPPIGGRKAELIAETQVVAYKPSIGHSNDSMRFRVLSDPVNGSRCAQMVRKTCQACGSAELLE